MICLLGSLGMCRLDFSVGGCFGCVVALWVGGFGFVGFGLRFGRMWFAFDLVGTNRWLCVMSLLVACLFCYFGGFSCWV